MTKKTATFLNS